ncbi:MAG: UvrD-helicase domain-containing protein, partial [Candidatus Magasanikbacteria bacterium]|nr:UvrD-helicase domain-containing protein [Candidatus Magasanikbacteria bacterium]
MQFNEQQQKIIDTVFGAHLISAPVGTGKTTILSERVVSALKNGIKPEEILCLTFTNKAAGEMVVRIKAKITQIEIVNALTIKTFHGFCANIVKAEAKELGLNTDFAIIDEEEQMQIFENILEEYPELKEVRNDKLFNKISRSRLTEMENIIGCNTPQVSLTKTEEQIKDKYFKKLTDLNVLDFNELVVYTLRILYLEDNLKKKWIGRYKFIQVDEFQDTHLSEYLVVKELAKVHKNITFIGDLDQTIYSWRGSNPLFIAKIFKVHFAPVIEHNLTENFRFNPHLLSAVKSFLSNFVNSYTKELTTRNNGGKEKCISMFGGFDFKEEISFVINELKRLRIEEPDATVAILSRGHSLIRESVINFEEKNEPFITVDKFRFFRRQEIKDLLACIKIIFNKFDTESAARLSVRPEKIMTAPAFKKMISEIEFTGLRVCDFFSFANFGLSEPFEKLVHTVDKGRLVVLDTETTGINPMYDEIIQIFAQEIVNGIPGDKRHFYLKNSIPVGLSENIHGLSDEFLKEKGEDSKTVLTEIISFIGKDVIVGHNVYFDFKMIVENCRRLDVKQNIKEFYDTLDLSRRFIKSENYKLSTLSKILNLSTATHSADDDVAATIDLFLYLAKQLKKHVKEREKFFKEYGNKFLSLALKMENWRKVIKDFRPDKAVEFIFTDSGLKKYYEEDDKDDEKIKNVQLLLNFLAHYDDIEKEPENSLQEMVGRF